MARHYNISTWRSSTASEASRFRKVFKINAALDECWRQIYAMLEGDGALDTQRAHRLLAEFNVFAADCEREDLMKSRHYFSRDFNLKSDFAGTLDHVKFVCLKSDRY